MIEKRTRPAVKTTPKDIGIALKRAVPPSRIILLMVLVMSFSLLMYAFPNVPLSYKVSNDQETVTVTKTPPPPPATSQPTTVDPSTPESTAPADKEPSEPEDTQVPSTPEEAPEYPTDNPDAPAPQDYPANTPGNQQWYPKEPSRGAGQQTQPQPPRVPSTPETVQPLPDTGENNNEWGGNIFPWLNQDDKPMKNEAGEAQRQQ